MQEKRGAKLVQIIFEFIIYLIVDVIFHGTIKIIRKVLCKTFPTVIIN
jgi:hypothetical protein